MTPQTLERAKWMMDLIARLEKGLRDLESYDFSVWPIILEDGGSLEFPRFADITEETRLQIEAIVKADLQKQLEELQQEFNEL